MTRTSDLVEPKLARSIRRAAALRRASQSDKISPTGRAIIAKAYQHQAAVVRYRKAIAAPENIRAWFAAKSPDRLDGDTRSSVPCDPNTSD
jgi:hypothetical protein